ncbi:unnamed protein product, partial [Prorocentrum cordatum]
VQEKRHVDSSPTKEMVELHATSLQIGNDLYRARLELKIAQLELNGTRGARARKGMQLEQATQLELNAMKQEYALRCMRIRRRQAVCKHCGEALDNPCEDMQEYAAEIDKPRKECTEQDGQI